MGHSVGKQSCEDPFAVKEEGNERPRGSFTALRVTASEQKDLPQAPQTLQTQKNVEGDLRFH